MALPAHAGTRDDAAFDAALNANRRRLFGIAFTVLRNRADAEDALQDALLKAWRAWPALADTESATAWLTRICVNQCIDHRRWLGRRHAAPADRDHPAPDEMRLLGPMLDLDRAFGTLSRQRAVLTLHNRYGYTVEECADILGCRAGSIRTHQARAMARLRQEMTR